MNNFDALNISQLPDLDSATVLEVKVVAGGNNTKAFCKGCGINWASLWSQEVDDEKYEFCPKCKSDHNLIDYKDEEDGYIMGLTSGLIMNIKTKKPLFTGKQLATASRPEKPFNLEDFKVLEEKRQKRVDHAIDQYHEGCKISEAEGQRMYREALQKR